MGVLRCSRKNCDNIMCSTYIPSVGYICDDCQQEFKRIVSKKDISLDSNSITKMLKEFITTESNNTPYQEYDSVDEFFRDHTD